MTVFQEPLINSKVLSVQLLRTCLFNNTFKIRLNFVLIAGGASPIQGLYSHSSSS